MSYNILSRLAKFEELIPTTVPFVESKLKGHQDRKNYSVIGPGVSEDADWTNTADLCSNPVYALNNQYEMSFTVEEVAEARKETRR